MLVKRHVRGKYDPLADDADLVEINPTYGKVRLPTGRELNVSIRDLAPLPEHCGNSPTPGQLSTENPIVLPANDSEELPQNNDFAEPAAVDMQEETINTAAPEHRMSI